MRSYKYLYNYESTAYYYIYKRNVRLNIVIYIKRIIIFNIYNYRYTKKKTIFEEEIYTKMKQQLYITLLFIFVIQNINALTKHKIDSLFNVLDVEIKNCHKYEIKKEDNIIKLKNKKVDNSFDSLYKYYLDLYNEYNRYCYDSAYYYINKSIYICKKYHKNDKRDELLAELAHYYAQTGNVIAAYQLLDSLKENNLNNNILYYISNEKLYDVLSETTNGSTKKIYITKRNQYTDSINKQYPITKDRYWEIKIQNLFRQNKIEECYKLWNDYNNDTRQYALLGWFIGCCYMQLGETNKAIECYILASIADIRSSTRDHGALPVLSEYLLSKGDIERAYKYIMFSCNQTLKHNGKLRIQSVLPLLTSIERKYNDMIKANRQKLISIISFITILSILLLLSFLYIYRLYKNNKRKKKELQIMYENNIRLTDSIKSINIQLENTNKELKISNIIREKYVLNFIQQSSRTITKIEQYNNQIKKIAINSKSKDVLNFIIESDFTKKQLDELYKSFDKAFLHIYPNFVENFNNMLLDDHKILLKKDERLTTDLRIYALEKLGVTNNNEIAVFLRCSVNTIYNYRTKIKSNLRVDKKVFDKFIYENV